MTDAHGLVLLEDSQNEALVFKTSFETQKGTKSVAAVAFSAAVSKTVVYEVKWSGRDNKKEKEVSLDDIDNPILYSTMALVAYNINIRYYKSLHYMWCTPYFSPNYDSPHYTVPPSSSPFEIYNTIKNEIRAGDRHGYKIGAIRVGIVKGAHSKLAQGVITDGQLRQIIGIAERADLILFRPLLCVISRREAVPYYQPVAIGDMANPLSYEYILADLPQSAFDIISVG